MTVSVLIPVLNEREALPKLINDIKSQTYDVKEIIVGDCGSADGTIEYLSSNEPNVRIAYSKTKNPAAARNSAAKLASGDIFLFLDADVTVDKTFIQKLVSRHKKLCNDLSSPKLLSDNVSISGNIHAWLVDRWVKRSYKKNTPVGAGGAVCVNKSLYKKLGGFNEKLQKGEDSDFSTRAYKTGSKVGYIDDICYIASSRRLRGFSGAFRTFFEDAPIFAIFYRKRSYDKYK